MKKIWGYRSKKGVSPFGSSISPGRDRGHHGTNFQPGYHIRDKDLGKVHNAASVGNVAKVQQVLLLGKNGLNDRDKMNRTALHLACANGHSAVVTVLLERKCRLDFGDHESRTALMKAVECQEEECATLLLGPGADPNGVDACGNTALHCAVFCHNLSLAAKLLSYNAYVDARNKKSPTSNEEVNVYKKQLLEREEELAELRAERNNTRLLLEHLEFLVSQNMLSLQMMAGKQQEQPPASMTSEVEVLRALKFLFDHHKALDEKLRERLRIAHERCRLLEEELGATHKERSSDGSLSHEQNLAKMSELQEVIDKQLREQSQMEEHLAALSAHMRELEEDLDTARRKLLKSKEVNRKLERDVRKAMAQMEDTVKRITTLEKRSLTAQREAAYVHDFNDKLENEIVNEDSMHRQARQGEDVKEEHNKPLSDTRDKPVSESDERLQLHLKERMAALEDKVQTLKEQGWERAQQASVLANVAQAFESDEGVSDGEGDGVTLFSSATQLSPRGQDDAETLIVTLQEQLYAINEESWVVPLKIRFKEYPEEVEKQNLQ